MHKVQVKFWMNYLKKNQKLKLDQKVDIKVEGQYANLHLKKFAAFETKFSDISYTWYVSIHAYVEEECIVQSDVVLGVRFIQQLGLPFDFKSMCVVSWDKLSIFMH